MRCVSGLLFRSRHWQLYSSLSELETRTTSAVQEMVECHITSAHEAHSSLMRTATMQILRVPSRVLYDWNGLFFPPLMFTSFKLHLNALFFFINDLGRSEELTVG